MTNPPTTLSRDDTISRVHEEIDRSFSDHIDRCREFLRQRSISATGEGIRETAEMVKGFVAEIGGTVRTCGSNDFPIIYGRVDGGHPRTLVIYGMYDVQPVEERRWQSPPFGAEIRELPGLGACIFARGAVNSKGALAGVFNALRSIRAVDRLPLNLIFTIEGEEEIGSPSFEPFIREHRQELKGIGVVDFDFSQDSSQKVSLHLGLKGIVYLDLVCRGGTGGGPTEVLHSAACAWLASPVWRLIHALGTMVDASDTITIDGFCDNIAPISDEEQQLLVKLQRTFDERAFLDEMRAHTFKRDLHGIELLKCGLYEPTINISGIHAGYTGRGTKTVLPRSATAKVDIRFGPDMEPEEVIDKLRRHLVRSGYDDIDVRVRDNYSWSRTEIDELVVQRIIESYQAHGHQPEIWPMATWAAPYFVFSRNLGLPVVSGGLGHGGKQHTPDEYMTVEGVREFEKFVVTFLYKLAA